MKLETSLPELIEAVGSPAFAILWQHWDEVRGHEAVPQHSVIRPERMSAILPSIFVLESKTPPNLTYRLLGTELVNLTKSDLTGLSVLSKIHPSRVETSKAYFHALLARPCGGILDYSVHLGNGQIRSRRLMHLPMQDTEGVVCRLIGVVDQVDPIGFEHDDVPLTYGKDLFECRYFDIGAGIP